MAQNNIPVIEIYWSLVDKADRKFSRVRDLPHYGRSRYDSYFQKVFKVYTQLWKFQQENRAKLVEAGLKRWEIGEIASRIAQLYYGQYLRTSEASYLSEAYIFYEAILSREYFKDGSSQDFHLANKQLRFLARFLILCLVLNRRDMVYQLVNQLKFLLDECKRNFQETDFKEWKLVVQEIVRFLKVDSAFMNIRPLRYSLVLDSHLDAVPNAASFEAKRTLRLRDAILSSYHHNEVKFTEITVDTFRMLQCLEWEPSGSFFKDSRVIGINVGQTGASGSNQTYNLQDITDPTLPPNPRKAILYHPSVTHLIAVLATICEELPPDGIILIYLSASGKGVQASQLPSSSGTLIKTTESIVGNFLSHEVSSDARSSFPFSSQHDSPANFDSQNKGIHEIKQSGCLWMGPRGNGGLNCLYPLDLIPFTRRPLFLIVDSDNSQAFKAIYEAEMVEPAAILLSPSLPSPAIDTTVDCSHHPGGSQFTMFLAAPLQAFCLMLGFSESEIEMDVYNKAEELLSSSLNHWGLALVTSDALDPVWAQVLCDPFLRRLLIRFIFFRTVVALYAPTFNKKEFFPDCLPCLPNSVLPMAFASQRAVLQIARIFGVTEHFIFSQGLSLSDIESDRDAEGFCSI